MSRAQPKIVTIPQKPIAFEVIGKRLEEAVSTKHLNKTSKSPESHQENLNYTFQNPQPPPEKHVISGGFKIPQGNYGKNVKISSQSLKETKENELEINNLLPSKREMWRNLGLEANFQEQSQRQDDENDENEFLQCDEPLENWQTIKNRKDLADKVIKNLDRSIEKIKMQREYLKNVKFY